jgi:hypothetical protein
MLVIQAWRARNGLGRSVVAPLLGLSEEEFARIEEGRCSFNDAERIAVETLFDDALPAKAIFWKFDLQTDGKLLDSLDEGFNRFRERFKVAMIAKGGTE